MITRSHDIAEIDRSKKKQLSNTMCTHHCNGPHFRSRLPHGPVFHDTVVMGKRYTAPEALAAGIVHQTCGSEELITEAVKVHVRLFFWISCNIRKSIVLYTYRHFLWHQFIEIRVFWKIYANNYSIGFHTTYIMQSQKTLIFLPLNIPNFTMSLQYF